MQSFDTTTPVLELRDATRSFQSGDSVVHALNHASLKIYQGEFVAIIGQSGSGKSTMMNILGCLDRLTEGAYLVNGRDVSEFSNNELAALRRDEFGFVFQRYNLLAGLSAQNNVEVPGIYQGQDATARHDRSAELLRDLGLQERMDFKPAQLSGGQQQRVAIARALMNNPQVILADEPTGALDRASSDDVMTLIEALHAQGHTVILITHDAEVAAHAHRQIHLQDGEIISDTGAKAHEIAREEIALSKGMSLGDSLKSALRIAINSLQMNWFRTMLTLLGIIIGVASVIALMALGTGQREDIMGRMTALGTNLITAFARDAKGFDMDDAEWIARIEGVEAVMPEISGQVTIRYKNEDIQTTVDGVTPNLTYVRDWSPSAGEFFSQAELDGQAAVAVLGQTVASTLFEPNQDPLGEYILIDDTPVQVIGVMAPKGSSSFGGDQDDVVFLPMTFAQTRLFNNPSIRRIIVKISSLEYVDAVESEMQFLLSEGRTPEDFRVRNMASFIQTANETAAGLTVFLAVVAAISLIVGGIGVMNIMLVSVTERTREIGVRMATGARQMDIMMQFLIEAVTVCAIGGGLGVIIGWSLGLAFGAFGINTVYTLTPTLLAFLSACMVGIIFGYLPARSASRLDPVDALADT